MCAGIILAGGIYPLIVCATVFFFASVEIAWAGITKGSAEYTSEDVVQFLLGFFAFGLLAGMVSMVYTTIVVAVTAPVVYEFVRSLRLRLDIVPLGAMLGGVVGLVAMLPVIVYVGFHPPPARHLFAELIIPLALGPGLTTIMGQIGGAWGGANSRRYGSPSRQQRWNRFLVKGLQPAYGGDFANSSWAT